MNRMLQCSLAILSSLLNLSPAEAAPAVRVRVVQDSSTGDYRKMRRMITGPGVNQHPPYPGCT